MTIDRETLEACRAEHRPFLLHTVPGSPEREACRIFQCGDGPWPCKQSQILDLALEAEGLKQGGGSLAQRELKDHYEQRAHKAEAENERLRGELARARILLDEYRENVIETGAEVERLRAALEEIRAECGNKPREWTKEIATVALGRD